MIITQNEETVRRGFWPKLGRVLSYVPFAEDAVASFYCAFDTATPLRAKGVLLGALAYFVMPVDVIPDFILGLGFTDDLTVLAAAMGMIRTHLKPVHREQAKGAIERIRRGAAA